METNADNKEISESTDFYQLNPDELKKIIDGWNRLMLVCIVWGLSLLLWIGGIIIPHMFMYAEPRFDAILYFIIPLICLIVAAIVGTRRKKEWGRILGIVLCSIMLIGIPIGTFFGIVGLIGYSGAKPLFGPNGIEYSKVKLAYNQNKKIGK
jgi:hypothetical protein